MITFNSRQYRKKPRRFDLDLIVPLIGKYSRVKHDEELAEFDFKPRQAAPNYPDYAVPATRRFEGNPTSFELSDAWCWRIVDMIFWAADGSITYEEACKVWRNLIRYRTAFTDEGAPELGYRDPITGENPKAKNIRWWNGACIGNIVKVKWYGTIEAFDPTLPPPPLFEILSQPWKWHWSTEQQVDGTLSNFPHIEAVSGFPCGVPVPLFGLGGLQTIDIEYIDRVENGKRYEVYK